MPQLDEIREAIEQYDKNLKTHSIVHRCFPPQDPICHVCGRSGDDLHRYPCSFGGVSLGLEA